MSEDNRKLNNAIQIDEAQVRRHLAELVRGSVEETGALGHQGEPQRGQQAPGDASGRTTPSSAFCARCVAGYQLGSRSRSAVRDRAIAEGLGRPLTGDGWVLALDDLPQSGVERGLAAA